ncbi:proteasome assembly chaperone 2 [Heterostelium album PN500]|uniref:Proteasome assembly chaperone 2 n=1 Tax=Heterostelium pallidum (strain ATCC 26659 / Pp 5 / PN500) TaxID=670386 RepID=D3B4J9_HETP5|nr:proteasome assembly chaperone 2 [Heterostelium album PN500]EFA84247.1 proteasome assembly chaperone 2 [Heterostelium album PN500]|eukprot:XP_020436363.1 proteasome assembly chaperone 2 [Heterostelium album PN500]
MEFFYPCKDSTQSSVSFQNSILIWPALTLGNVGQLSIDLILNTFGFKKVGYIHDEDIVPLAGNDTLTPAGKGVLSTAVEVYQFTNRQNTTITIVQQRSPIIAGHINRFAEKLNQWIKQSGFSQLLFLASTNANKRIDTQLFGTQIRYVASDAVGDNQFIVDRIEKQCGVPPMERSVVIDGDLIELSDRLTGLGRRLMTLATQENSKGIAMVAFILFCSEGDNTQDAIVMSNHVVQYTELTTETSNNNNNTIDFKIPSSWSLIKDGPSINQALYF